VEILYGRTRIVKSLPNNSSRIWLVLEIIHRMKPINHFVKCHHFYLNFRFISDFSGYVFVHIFSSIFIISLVLFCIIVFFITNIKLYKVVNMKQKRAVVQTIMVSDSSFVVLLPLCCLSADTRIFIF
jgi:hypothetical protein